MLQQISTLDKEVTLARKAPAKPPPSSQPSVFDALNGSVPKEVVHSFSIFVAKEKERDAFVTAASKLHRFAETISALDMQTVPDTRALVARARAVLQVCGSHVVIL